MKKLTEVRAALLRELAGDNARLCFVNTRLILSTGVNLNEIKPVQDEDAKHVTRAMDALRKMGFLEHSVGGRP